MHAFTYQLYLLKSNPKLNFRFKDLSMHLMYQEKNQILKPFSKYIYQFLAYETCGSDTTVGICVLGHTYVFQKFYFLNTIVE